jgi:hypothetical protein
MPIRLNLLAEAQAAEESRRKDPVKRALLVAILVVLGVVGWSSTLQVKIARLKGEMNGLQANWKSIEKSYQAAIDTQHLSTETEEKLSALQQLTTNRPLWGTTLNALQQTLNGIDDVQVLRVKADQTYTFTEEVKPKAGETKTQPKPATATEHIVMTIEGVDYSTPPGGRINRFKAAIANEPFFQSTLNKTNGVSLLSFSPPQVDGSGRPAFVKFSLQCLFPEKVRQ